jgi:hypothetical protein
LPNLLLLQKPKSLTEIHHSNDASQTQPVAQPVAPRPSVLEQKKIKLP